MADLEKLRQLRQEFPEELIGKKPKVWCRACSSNKADRHCGNHQIKHCRTCKQKITEAHLDIEFVGHAHVTERLLDVDLEWDWEPLAYDSNGMPLLDANNGIWIKLTVAGKTRIGYGGADGKTGDDAVKEAISDAIKTTAMRYGVALNLWKREKPDADEPKSNARPAPATKEQAERQQANELRGQIKVLGGKRGLSVAQISDDFASWSRGSDITKAGPATLIEYKDHLLRQEEVA